MGFEVWVAINDRNRTYGGGRLCDGCIDTLPATLDQAPGADAIRLIDILWLEPGDGRVAGAFEVEHTTSIYSGIVRLLDLALSGELHATASLFLVAPDDREGEVRTQLVRPAFSRVRDLTLRFLPYGELKVHREAMARFGMGMKAIEAVSRVLV